MGQFLSLYHLPKQHSCSYSKGAFLWGQSQLMLLNPFEGIPQVNDVTLSFLGFHNHIIDIHFYLIVHHII